MAVTLNRRAFDHAKELINEGRIVLTSEMHGASTGRLPSRRMNSFASTALPNTAGGIWESTTKSPSRPKDTTNFHMGISARSTAVACSRQRAAPANTNTMTSKTRVAHLHGMLDARKGAPASKRTRAASPGKTARGADIQRGDTIAVSAVHDPNRQAEQHAQQKTCHQRKIKRYIFPLDHDVAG